MLVCMNLNFSDVISFCSLEFIILPSANSLLLVFYFCLFYAVYGLLFTLNSMSMYLYVGV